MKKFFKDHLFQLIYLIPVSFIAIGLNFRESFFPKIFSINKIKSSFIILLPLNKFPVNLFLSAFPEAAEFLPLNNFVMLQDSQYNRSCNL